MNLLLDKEMSFKKYNVRLKDTIKTFTKRLFYALIDEQH